jgi:hypothetical protein
MRQLHAFVPWLLFPEHRGPLGAQVGRSANEEQHDNKEGAEIKDSRLRANVRGLSWL